MLLYLGYGSHADPLSSPAGSVCFHGDPSASDGSERLPFQGQLTKLLSNFQTKDTMIVTKFESRVMVRNINVALNDGDYDEVTRVKDELSLMWEGFLMQAAHYLDEHGLEE